MSLRRAPAAGFYKQTYSGFKDNSVRTGIKGEEMISPEAEKRGKGISTLQVIAGAVLQGKNLTMVCYTFYDC